MAVRIAVRVTRASGGAQASRQSGWARVRVCAPGLWAQVALSWGEDECMSTSGRAATKGSGEGSVVAWACDDLIGFSSLGDRVRRAVLPAG